MALADLHENLLAGRTGRLVNGIGSCFVTLLSLTGAIIWWPGVRNWRRSTTIKWKANFPRLNWDLHSAIGFWCWFFVLVWGISGIYFCFPALFGPRIHLAGGSFLSLIAQLHMGRFDCSPMPFGPSWDSCLPSRPVRALLCGGTECCAKDSAVQGVGRQMWDCYPFQSDRRLGN